MAYIITYIYIYIRCYSLNICGYSLITNCNIKNVLNKSEKVCVGTQKFGYWISLFRTCKVFYTCTIICTMCIASHNFILLEVEDE